MPSHIIHFLAGRAALGRFDGARDFPYAEAFAIGCQGPDIFSHNRRTRPFALAFARLLHRRSYGLFCLNFARALRENPSDLAASWFLGFVTHQAADRIFHPYIVYRSFLAGATGIPGVPPTRFHVFLERILDSTLFELLEGTPVASFDTGSRFELSEDDIRELSWRVATALAATYPEETGESSELKLRTANAFRDAIYFYRMTNPAEVSMRYPVDASRTRAFSGFGIDAVALLFPESLSGDVDWLNEAGQSWLHPVSGIERTYSARELFSSAVDIASSCMAIARDFLSGLARDEDLETGIGNGSLSVSGEDGKIGLVRFADPFDLAPVLLDQADRRRRWLSMAIAD